MQPCNFLAAVAAVLLAGCGRGGTDSQNNKEVAPDGGTRHVGWTLDRSGGGAVVALASVSGEVEMRLVCPGDRRFLVNVPAFRPVASEERMTFGQGGKVETMVADPSGDPIRGGVTASADVPANLYALLAGKVAANYGSQNSGPHPPLPADMARKFVESCGTAGNGSASGSGGKPAPAPPPRDISACLVQGGRRIPDMKLHAVGTEPFWAANVKGRCVTYSHPENQDGTRVWTEFSGTAENGTWSGYLDNARFVMRTRPQRGCSDGMSDKRYPIAVSLTVRGEERRGCADFR